MGNHTAELSESLDDGMKRAKFEQLACTELSRGVCKKEGYFLELPEDHPKRNEL